MTDAHKNFAYSTVATAPSPGDTGLSLIVAAGDGPRFPAVPFNAVVCPAGQQPLVNNSEIVRVTGIASDTLTIARQQEGSNVRTILVGDQIFAGPTAKTFTDIESALSGSAAVDTSMARMYRAAGGFSITVAAAKVLLDTVAYDPGSNVTGNNRYVCPATGYYAVEGELGFTGSAGGIVGVAKNGVLVSYGVGAGFTASVSDLIYCNAGDYLELWAASSTQTLLSGTGVQNYFAVSRVGVGIPGMTGASGVSSAMQQGAVLANDAALTVNSSTQVTIGAASTFFVQNAAGVLVPVAISSTALSAIAAAATFTRLDQIVVDSTGTVTRLAGAESNGVTLANRTGAAAIPAGSRLLHDILVTTGGVLVANVRDRRPWARGGYNRLLRNANAGGGNDYTTASASLVVVDATNLSVRMECLSGMVRATLRGRTSADAAGRSINFNTYVDGGGVDGSTATPIYGGAVQGTSQDTPLDFSWDLPVSAGSHLFVPYWSTGGGGTASIYCRAGIPLIFTVEEIVRQNANNGIA